MGRDVIGALAGGWIEESTRRMHAGIGLLKRGDPVEALPHFDAAIGLRERLPWQSDSAAAWMLAAAWLNRGDALHGTGDRSNFRAAIAAWDNTIVVMNHVPLENDPAFPERLILAWINRAGCCYELGEEAEGGKSFARASALLDEWGRGVTPTRDFLEAMGLVNQARVLVDRGNHRQAWVDTGKAVVILTRLGAESALLKAWSLQCRSLANMLGDRSGECIPDDWIARATDAVEEALALAKAGGYTDGWLADLVRYGAKIYRVCQPHFLAEFLCDCLADGPYAQDGELLDEMGKVLLLAQAELEQRVLAAAEDTGYVQGQIEILKSFQWAGGRLNLARP